MEMETPLLFFIVLFFMTEFDPAVMASPFITTIVDAISLFTYFNIATLILGI